MKRVNADTICEVCDALTASDVAGARQILEERYPFEPRLKTVRKTTPYQLMCLFLRDGFVDRYSGLRLVNPGVLRLLSWRLPGAFPAHKNWKASDTHAAYYELFPTVDHFRSVARGGADEAAAARSAWR